MRTLAWLFVVSALVGCQSPSIPVPGGGSVSRGGDTTIVTGPDGSKMSVDESGGGVKVESRDADGNKVTAETDAQGRMTMRNEKGEVTTMGQGSPTAWIEPYPGAKPLPERSLEADTAESKATSATFTFSDDPENVAAFYESRLKGAKRTTMETDGNKVIFLNWEEGKRQAVINITVTKEGERTLQINTTERKP